MSRKHKPVSIGLSEQSLDRREYLLAKQAERKARERQLLSEKWRNELRGIADALEAAGL